MKALPPLDPYVPRVAQCHDGTGPIRLLGPARIANRSRSLISTSHDQQLSLVNALIFMKAAVVAAGVLAAAELGVGVVVLVAVVGVVVVIL